MNPDIKSILYNIIGGIIVSILTALYIGAHYRIRLYHLQRLLGFKFKPKTTVTITYGQFLLPPLTNQSGQIIAHPYVKTPRHGGAIPLVGSYSIEHPVSECEVRASTYIAMLLGRPKNLQPQLFSDVEVSSVLDSNFVSFGGSGSNYKTADILASRSNIFIRMAHTGFSLPSGESLPFSCSRAADHGFILRIIPPEFPTRSWIVCAGLGEWGTSGAAWFLANKWTELIRSIHPIAYRSGIMRIPDFLAIIRVVPGQDQSDCMAALYRNDRGQIKRIMMRHS
jgi:hypothetical protein